MIDLEGDTAHNVVKYIRAYQGAGNISEDEMELIWPILKTKSLLYLQENAHQFFTVIILHIVNGFFLFFFRFLNAIGCKALIPSQLTIPKLKSSFSQKRMKILRTFSVQLILYGRRERITYNNSYRPAWRYFTINI